MDLVRLEGYVSLRLDLTRAATAAPLPAAWTVRELSRAEAAAIDAPDKEAALARLDAALPGGWRCFAVLEGERLVHRSFIELRPGLPLLFGAETRPDARGRGAFRATVAYLARALSAAGATTLASATVRSNRASLRAHRAAGFVVVSEAIDVIVFGVSLRNRARRLLRGWHEMSLARHMLRFAMRFRAKERER